MGVIGELRAERRRAEGLVAELADELPCDVFDRKLEGRHVDVEHARAVGARGAGIPYGRRIAELADQLEAVEFM